MNEPGRRRNAETRSGCGAVRLVFDDEVGRPVTAGQLRGTLERASDAAGLPWSVFPHDLRHTWASHAIAPGVPITAVSAHLGHADASITLGVYSHLVGVLPDTGAVMGDVFTA